MRFRWFVSSALVVAFAALSLGACGDRNVEELLALTPEARDGSDSSPGATSSIDGAAPVADAARPAPCAGRGAGSAEGSGDGASRDAASGGLACGASSCASGSGTVCCVDPLVPSRTKCTTTSACVIGVIQACDGPSDCGGDRCCVVYHYVAGSVTTERTCQASCLLGASGESCTDDNDCASSTGSCKLYSCSNGAIHVRTCKVPVGCEDAGAEP